MLQIKNNVVYLTKGDTAYLEISLVNDAGEPYEMFEGDKLTLTVKPMASDTAQELFHVESTSTTLYIRPEDTSSISAGKYSFDVQLTRHDGGIFTVIGAEPGQGAKLDNFILMPEVTR